MEIKKEFSSIKKGVKYKKTIKFGFLLLLLISVILSNSCENESDTNPIYPADIITEYMDGPYVFYIGNNIKIVHINSSNKITETFVDHVDSLLVIVPKHKPEQFYVKLKPNNEKPPSTYDAVDNIFAISDIEGNYYSFVNLLIGNKITDEKLNWIYGNGHLVFNGDILDRGKYVTQVMWLLYKLEQEADAAGGKVHLILGNHEVMNLEGDHRYVADKYVNLAKQLNISEADFYNENNEMGRWLRSKNIIEKIGDDLFVHGGISSTLLDKNLSIEEINKIAQDNYGINLPNDLLTNANLIIGTFGPLWYRGLVEDYTYYDKATDEEVDNFLDFYSSNRVIIGHTIVEEVSTDYDGKVVRIDVHHPESTNSEYNSEALIIQNNILYKVDDIGNRTKL